ncbi:MAG: E3 binding domain-containing protein [Nocardioides sp.]
MDHPKQHLITGRRYYTPAVAQHAADLGVDLEQITHCSGGFKGEITMYDVDLQNAAEVMNRTRIKPIRTRL